MNTYLINKLAAGVGLTYMSQEFKDIDDGVKSIVNEYRKNFSENVKNKISPQDIDIAKKILNRNIKLIGDFKIKIKSMVGSFIKSIERNHKKEIEKHLGEDFETHLANIVSDPDAAYNPSRGTYVKYKLIFQLLSGSDKELLNRVTKYIEHEVKIFTTKFEQQLEEIYNMMGAEINIDNSWVHKYENLFKFAQEEIELGDEDIEEINVESIGLKLKNNEVSALKAMVELWKLYKDEFTNSKYSAILENKMDIMRRIYAGFVSIEKNRSEMLESIFDQIRALDKMLRAYIEEGNPEGDFFDRTGLTFSNAFAKIDMYIYTLSTLFPPNAHVSKLIKKMPRKFDPNDQPKWEAREETFFERGKEYEEGKQSGIEEKNKGEVIFNARVDKKPLHPRSVIPSTLAYYLDVSSILKKSSNKI